MPPDAIWSNPQASMNEVDEDDRSTSSSDSLSPEHGRTFYESVCSKYDFNFETNQSLDEPSSSPSITRTANTTQHSINSTESAQSRRIQHVSLSGSPFVVKNSSGPLRPLSRHSSSSDISSPSSLPRSLSPFKGKNGSPHETTRELRPSTHDASLSFSASSSSSSFSLHARPERDAEEGPAKRHKHSSNEDPLVTILSMVDRDEAKKTVQAIRDKGLPDIPERRRVHWNDDQVPSPRPPTSHISASTSTLRAVSLRSALASTKKDNDRHPTLVSRSASDKSGDELHRAPAPALTSDRSESTLYPPQPPVATSSMNDSNARDKDGGDIFKRPFDIKDKENHPPPPPPPPPSIHSHVVSNTGGTPGIGTEIKVQDERYTVLGKIGSGGSSQVYEVVSQRLQRKFAIKCVRISNIDKSVTDGYKDEIRLLHRLDKNDRIVRLYQHDIRPSEQLIYLVLELGSIDFAHLLAKRKGQPLNYHFVRYYWQQMLEAVAAIHELKIVHSDLKPANFILVHDTLKLIDFGIAKAISNDTTNIQRENQLGTLNYMSPETLRGTDKDGNCIIKHGRPSDVWSLGCILYQMVYGYTPFHAFTQQLPKMHAIMNPDHKIQFPNMLQYDNHSDVVVQESLLSVLKSCLDREPKIRMTIPELLTHRFLQ